MDWTQYLSGVGGSGGGAPATGPSSSARSGVSFGASGNQLLGIAAIAGVALVLIVVLLKR